MKYTKEQMQDMVTEIGEGFLEKAHKISKAELSVEETAMMIKALAKWKIAMDGEEDVLQIGHKF